MQLAKTRNKCCCCCCCCCCYAAAVLLLLLLLLLLLAAFYNLGGGKYFWATFQTKGNEIFPFSKKRKSAAAGWTKNGPINLLYAFQLDNTYLSLFPPLLVSTPTTTRTMTSASSFCFCLHLNGFCKKIIWALIVARKESEKTLTYFVMGSVTVQLVSSLSGLDSTKHENMVYLYAGTCGSLVQEIWHVSSQFYSCT